LRKHALAQHGAFTLAQALDCGFTREAVRRRLGSERWEEIDVRVYRVKVATPPSARQSLMARTLSTKGVAARRSAGALHHWNPFPSEPEILVTKGRRASQRDGVHITDTLPQQDIVVVDGIRTTSAVRTLIDLGGVMPFDEFEDVFDTAVLSGAVRRHRLATRATALRAPRRRGAALALRLLDDRNPELNKARNLWEARVLRLLDRAGVPRPRVNYAVRVDGRMRYVDFAWPEHKVFVEFDGFATHAPRRPFEDDRTRQNALVDQEWAPYRLTKRALEHDSAAALGPVVRALRRRSTPNTSARKAPSRNVTEATIA
jgi:very-short-patch-repair endonuclease